MMQRALDGSHLGGLTRNVQRLKIHKRAVGSRKPLRLSAAASMGPTSSGSGEGSMRPEGIRYVMDRQREVLSAPMHEEEEEFEEEYRRPPPPRPSSPGRALLQGSSSASKVHIDESDPARFPFHRNLARCAQLGMPKDALTVITAMQRDGLLPGPSAHHALVFAYLKAGLPDQALEAASRAAETGIDVLPETYLVLIADRITRKDFRMAFDLYDAMKDRKLDLQKAWSLLGSALFRAGHPDALRFFYDTDKSDTPSPDDAFDQYQDAAPKPTGPKLIPDADHLAFLIEALVAEGNYGRARGIMERFQQAGRTVEARHTNILLRGYCSAVDMKEAVEGLLTGMKEGQYGLPRPNAQTLEYMADGLARRTDKGAPSSLPGGFSPTTEPPESGDVDNEEQLEEIVSVVKNLATQYNLRPSARFYALMVDNYCKMGSMSTGEALRAYRAMRAAAPSAKPSNLLTDGAVARLLTRLSESCMPYDMLTVMLGMLNDGRRVPPQLWRALNGRDQSAITMWIGGKPDIMGPRAAPAAVRGGIAEALRVLERRQQEEEEEPVIEVDGVKIGRGKCCVDEEGRVLPVSKLTTLMLRAELRANGVDVGSMKRKDMYKKVQQLRRQDEGLKEIARRLKKEKERADKRAKILTIGGGSEDKEKEKERDREDAAEDMDDLGAEGASTAQGASSGESSAAARRRAAGERNYTLFVAGRSVQSLEEATGDDLPKSVGSKGALGRGLAAVEAEVEYRRRLQQALGREDDEYRSLLNSPTDVSGGSGAAEDSDPSDNLRFGGRGYKGGEEEGRAAGSSFTAGEDTEEESVYIDGNRQFFSDYLDLGANQSNDTGGIEHAYNLIAVASRLGMKPRLGDLSALMAAIEEAEPPYERAAFYLLRKMEEFVRDEVYVRDEVLTITERCLKVLAGGRDKSTLVEACSYMGRAGVHVPPELRDALRRAYSDAVAGEGGLLAGGEEGIAGEEGAEDPYGDDEEEDEEEEEEEEEAVDHKRGIRRGEDEEGEEPAEVPGA